jgi:hypothetical protein
MWDKIENILDFATELNDYADSTMVVQDIGVILEAEKAIRDALGRMKVELNNRELSKMVKEVLNAL